MERLKIRGAFDVLTLVAALLFAVGMCYYVSYRIQKAISQSWTREVLEGETRSQIYNEGFSAGYIEGKREAERARGRTIDASANSKGTG